jgi:hypothetical protein
VTGRIWRDLIVSFAAALLLSWLALVIALVIRRPKGDLLKESVRLLPDLLRLLRRLNTNRDLPTGVRVRVALPFVYLAIPIRRQRHPCPGASNFSPGFGERRRRGLLVSFRGR